MYYFSIDIQRYLICQLSYRDIIHLGATCKRFHSLSKDELIWKSLLLRDHPSYCFNNATHYRLMYKFLTSVKSFRKFNEVDLPLIKEFSVEQRIRSISFIHPTPGALVEAIEEDYILAPDIVIIHGCRCFALLENKRLPSMISLYGLPFHALNKETLQYEEDIGFLDSCNRDIYRSSLYPIRYIDYLAESFSRRGYLYLGNCNDILTYIAGDDVRTHADLFQETKLSLDDENDE